MKNTLKAFIKSLTSDSIGCYHECKKSFGCDFDSVMAELAADITIIQYRHNVSFAEGCLMLINNFPPQSGKNVLLVSAKAAFCWHAFESSEMERALRELR